MSHEGIEFSQAVRVGLHELWTEGLNHHHQAMLRQRLVDRCRTGSVDEAELVKEAEALHSELVSLQAELTRLVMRAQNNPEEFLAKVEAKLRSLEENPRRFKPGGPDSLHATERHSKEVHQERLLPPPIDPVARLDRLARDIAAQRLALFYFLQPRRKASAKA